MAISLGILTQHFQVQTHMLLKVVHFKSPPRAGQTQAPSQPELLCSTRSAVALKFTIAMAARRMLAGDLESYHDIWPVMTCESAP